MFGDKLLAVVETRSDITLERVYDLTGIRPRRLQALMHGHLPSEDEVDLLSDFYNYDFQFVAAASGVYKRREHFSTSSMSVSS